MRVSKEASKKKEIRSGTRNEGRWGSGGRSCWMESNEERKGISFVGREASSVCRGWKADPICKLRERLARQCLLLSLSLSLSTHTMTTTTTSFLQINEQLRTRWSTKELNSEPIRQLPKKPKTHSTNNKNRGKQIKNSHSCCCFCCCTYFLSLFVLWW